MAYPSILVIGGSGFIGNHLVAQLAAADTAFCHAILVPTRHVERAKHLLALPKVDVIKADVHDEAQLHCLLQERRINAVINLVGILKVQRRQFTGYDQRLTFEAGGLMHHPHGRQSRGAAHETKVPTIHIRRNRRLA